MKIGEIAVTLLWLGCAAAAGQSVVKVGLLNMQKALVTTKDGQKALADLQARVAPKQKEFAARQQEIASLEDQLRTGANLLTDEKKAALGREVDGKKKKLERDVQDAQEDVQAKQQQVLEGLGQKLMAVVARYAKDHQFTLILEGGEQSSSVVFAADSIDVTSEIVALYDKQNAALAGKE